MVNLLCIENEIKLLRGDFRKAEHELVKENALDFALVSSMHTISAEVYPLIKYFEKSDGLTVPSFLPKMLDLLAFGLKDCSNSSKGDQDVMHNRWLFELKNCLVETMINYLTGYTTFRCAKTNDFLKATGVPNRCTSIVLAANYLNFPESRMSCWKVEEALKTTLHPRKDDISYLVKKKMIGKWKTEAKRFISAQYKPQDIDRAQKDLSATINTTRIVKTRIQDPGFNRQIQSVPEEIENNLEAEFEKYENFYSKFIKCKIFSYKIQ